MVSETITLIITGFMFVLFVIWLFWMAYWILGKFGIWKWATYHRLKKRYKDVGFKDDAITWAVDKIHKEWKFKDIKRFVKYEKDGGELLYTFMALSKLSPLELENITEKEVDYDGGQTIDRPEEEVSRTFGEIPKETDSEETSS